MKRWLLVLFCTILGLAMLGCGLLVPAHLRAVDVNVLKLAGRKGRPLVDAGLALLQQKQVGPAQELLQAAKSENLRGADQLEEEVERFTKAYPRLVRWGGEDFYVERVFQNSVDSAPTNSQACIEFLVQTENREKILEFLSGSGVAEVRGVLQCRTLTNTTLFAPSHSASGQAWDSALALTGLLLHEHRLQAGLHEALAGMAAEASRGGNPQKFEQALLDLMSLGQRFNWLQLTAFVEQIGDTDTLGKLSHMARKAEARLPSLFAAVYLSANPAGVAAYLLEFTKSGWKDLTSSLRYGAGGVKELLRRNQPLYSSAWRNEIIQFDPAASFFYAVLEYCSLTPWAAIALKWFLYAGGGFLLALAFHFGKPAVTALEMPLQVRGVHIAREFLFALGFLLVVLLLSEPFLAQESQKVEFIPFRLRLPMVGSAALAGIAHAPSSFMNPPSLLTLLLFFILQALIYTACLIKLAEIRRQNIAPRVKLRLLENEDHLFDAGLYLGFVGTIISLILVSLNVIKPSLMAAYSSTSFGIIFVVIFKIFHLRPLRRKLLLETEAIPS